MSYRTCSLLEGAGFWRGHGSIRVKDPKFQILNIDFSKNLHDTFFVDLFNLKNCDMSESCWEINISFCITHPIFFFAGNVLKNIPNKFENMFIFGRRGVVCWSYCITDPGHQYVARSCFSRQLFQDFKLYRKLNITDIDF